MDFLKSSVHPEELVALIRFKFGACETVMPKCDFTRMSPTMKQCYDFLNQTSRSFAAVIQALEGDLRTAMCIMYLVLRAMDTVEDDMSIPYDVKVSMLKSFYKNLEDPDWKYTESKDKDRIVLEHFPSISKEYRALSPLNRTIISETCMKMGQGMTKYLIDKVDTLEDWDEYCYFVAGLVGIALGRLFAASGMEDQKYADDVKTANEIGLFLQKTNIIRDYLEDWNDKRIFWPKAIWSKYGKDIGDFAQPENSAHAVQCMNELITNSLELVPNILKFMAGLKTRSVFSFVAIPQVMAIGTLERCYNNPKVFSSVVKIRKGEAVRMMLGCTCIDNVRAMMRHFVLEIMKKIPDGDPSAAKTRRVCQKALEATKTSQTYSNYSIYPSLYVTMSLGLSAIAYTYWSQITQWYLN